MGRLGRRRSVLYPFPCCSTIETVEVQTGDLSLELSDMARGLSRRLVVGLSASRLWERDMGNRIGVSVAARFMREAVGESTTFGNETILALPAETNVIACALLHCCST